MSNIYKYRVGKKWYTFDKSILEPQDVRVFDLANWNDKLKIITIYQDLKPHDNDDVIILKTKKENPNKDKRAAEYRAKKQKLEKDLVEANRTNNEEQQARLIKQLNELDIEYADIINIQNAETVNIAKANQVILKDVNELIKQTNDTLDQLKTSLTEADFNTINDNIEELLEANNKTQINDNITAINDKLEELNNTTLIPTVKKGVEIMLSTMKNLKKAMEGIEESETINKLIEYGFFKDITQEDEPYLNVMVNVLAQIRKSDISQDDLTTLAEYPYAAEWLKDNSKQPLNDVNQLCELIRLFVKVNALKEDSDVKAIGFDPYESKSERKVRGRFKYDITENVDFENFFNNLQLTGYDSKFDLFAKFKGDTKTYIATYRLFKTTDNTGFYDVIKTIVDNKQVLKEDNPGAVEGRGFLGLKTSKSAKQDYEELKKEITTLKKQIGEMSIEINNLRNTRLLKEQVPITEGPKVPAAAPETPEPEPIIIQTNQSTTTKPSFLTDLNKRKDQLKHAEPIQKQPELTDLQKLLNRRRQDIAPDEYEEEDGEDWGEGLGGILRELQRDLEKYGLVLSLSPDGKAYFVNVYDKKRHKASENARRQQGNGVAEANTLVNSVNENTEYKDLKKLYESLY